MKLNLQFFGGRGASGPGGKVTEKNKKDFTDALRQAVSFGSDAEDAIDIAEKHVVQEGIMSRSAAKALADERREQVQEKLKENPYVGESVEALERARRINSEEMAKKREQYRDAQRAYLNDDPNNPHEWRKVRYEERKRLLEDVEKRMELIEQALRRARKKKRGY